MIRSINAVAVRRHNSVLSGWFNQITYSFMAVFLASCSGGNLGGNGLSDNPSATFHEQAAEPSAPFNAANWSSSQEYRNSTGLAQVKAAAGYARRTGGLPGGQGVRIAIIDSGIDITHPDLGNLLAQSWSAGGEALEGDSHGTFVAGIAGASRTQTGDPNDMHGLAYRATLVNFQAARPSVTATNGSASFTSVDLVEALFAASGLTNGAESVESDIFNLSLGAFSNSDSSFNSLRNAMRAAAAEDKIMVLAAGNEGLSADSSRKLQPIYPAAYADDVGIAGHAIVVGNATSGNVAAASSNFCGDTKDYCLFAPGTNIRSTLDGGGYGVGSGTSFAAPHVSGAAAVVKAAFPGVSGEDVVDRLLLTAQDLGDPGVDTIYGRGLLDLEAAMSPVGPVGLTLGRDLSGPRIEESESLLDLGPALVISNRDRERLEKAVGFDDMGFPFPVDLGERIVTRNARSGVQRFIAGGSGSSAGTPMPHGYLSVASADDIDDQIDADPAMDRQVRLFSRTETSPEPHLSFQAAPIADMALFASFDGQSHTAIGLQKSLADGGMSALDSASILTPFDSLAGAVSGGGVALMPGNSLDIAISAFTSQPHDTMIETSIQKIEIKKQLTDHIDLRLGMGWLQEEGGFLGARSSGAFGETSTGRSQFAEISLTAAISDRVDWFGTYSRGQVSIASGENGLLSDWSSARAEAFGTGLLIRDLSLDGDRLTLMVGQPLRGDHAETTVTLPVGRTPDGQVITEQQRIDLSPSAREIASEVIYRWSFGRAKAQELGIGGFARFNPGHDADRPPEFGLGAQYRWQF